MMGSAGQNPVTPEPKAGRSGDMAETRLWFLDQIRIHQGGTEVASRILPRKLIALLGILAAERTSTAPVETVCRLLWPEAGEPNCRKSLNQLLLRGRRVLPNAIERPAEHLLGLSASVSCDARDLLFAEPFASQSTAPPHAGFEFLPGFSIRGCPELNDWLDTTRTALRSRAAKAALRRANELAGLNAFSWAALAYRLDRADERAAAAYIRALSEVRGPSAAWAAFTKHRRWLAETLDITPSANLTGIAAAACRQAGESAPAPAPATPKPPSGATATSSASATIVGPDRRRRFVGHWWPHALAAMGVLAVLSALVLKTMGTSRAEAGTGGVDVVLSVPPAAGALVDSALGLAMAHLAGHQVAAELVNGPPGAGLRVVLPAWRGERAVQVSVSPQRQPTPAVLAAAVVDSVLGLVRHGRGRAAAGGDRAREAARADLAPADSAVGAARALIGTGGPSAALVMLERADSLAAAAARAHSADWRPLVLRAEIANLRFWQRASSGVMDQGALDRGIGLADAAVLAGGGAAAVEARAALRFSLWVSGASGAAAAGPAALADFAATVVASPDHGEAWTRLAQLYHAEGRFSDAYSAALHAEPLVTGPARLDALMELFLAALDGQDNAEALRWCQEVGFHYPDSWLSAYCSALYAWADPASTELPAEPSLFAEPTNLRPLLERRLALLGAGADLARGNPAAAHREMAAALPGLAADPELASTWAGLLVQLGQPDSALATLRAYLQPAPSRRIVAGRPWFRPLFRPAESWRDFMSRLTEPRPTAARQE